MENGTDWIAAVSAAVVAIGIIAGTIATAIKRPFARIRETVAAVREDLHGDIAKIGAKVDGILKESQNDINHVRERVNGLESNLRDRVGWIEGFLRKSTEAPDKYNYTVRETGRSEPDE